MSQGHALYCACIEDWVRTISAGGMNFLISYLLNTFAEFVYEFLYQLADLAESEKVHGCCKTAYESTLAKHHPWMIRKGALVAMYTLPTQGELLKRVCTNVSTATECLPEMLKATKTVYDRTHALYTIHDLHSLP